MNSKEFSLTIENIVKEKKISHMDAVIFEDSSVENIYNFESAINGTLVNPL